MNDQWGHPVGDIVLQQVSHCLLRERRGDMVVARWGGEEFVMVLFHKEVDEAIEMAESLRQAVEQLQVVVDDGQVLRVTASFGVAQVNDVDNFASFEGAFREADQALYAAKQSGRNCVKVFGEELFLGE